MTKSYSEFTSTYNLLMKASAFIQNSCMYYTVINGCLASI